MIMPLKIGCKTNSNQGVAAGFALFLLYFHSCISCLSVQSTWSSFTIRIIFVSLLFCICLIDWTRNPWVPMMRWWPVARQHLSPNSQMEMSNITHLKMGTLSRATNGEIHSQMGQQHFPRDGGASKLDKKILQRLATPLCQRKKW